MTGPFGRPPEDQPRPSDEEINQSRMEHEEWVQEKEQEMEDSEVCDDCFQGMNGVYRAGGKQ